MIKVEGLTHNYGNRQIKYPDFEVSTGAHFTILGNSGSGKTTLLHLLAGLRKAQSGSISLYDQELTSLGERERDKFRGNKIGLVFQRPHLLGALTVRENLLAGQFFSGQKQGIQRVEEVLEELNITHKGNEKPERLSQGEAQRVAIARAVINRPQIMMADEPTSSLDDDNCEQVLKLLVDEARTYQATLIVVTHDQRVKERIPEGITITTG